MKVRDYQEAARQAVWNYFVAGNTGNPLVAMPTGTGKSFCIGDLIISMITAYPGTRILNLTHVKELIENNYKTLMRLMPTAPAGVYSAGLKRKDVHAQITFAGIQSISKRAKLFGRTDIIIIDEAHLVSPNDSARYAKFIAAIKAYNPNVKVIGYTATPFRLGLGHLTEGELFDDVCFDLTSGDAFIWMIENGYLAPLVPKATETQIDLDGAHIRGGEFIESELRELIDAQGVIDHALVEAVQKAHNRQHWLVFTTSIDHCDEVAEKLTRLGITALPVHSKLPGNERDENIAKFQRGEIQALVNKDILTTGFDAPHVDCIIMLRPTQSPGLWVQMLGRGTRPWFIGHNGGPPLVDEIETVEGRFACMARSPKRDCLVLDFAANTARLGPINYPKMPKKKGDKSGDAPVRVCESCGTYVHISHRVCPECGADMPFEDKTNIKASDAELVAREKPKSKKPEKPPKEEVTFSVDSMLMTKHQKPGKPDRVRVDYYCGVRRFSEYIGPEDQGFMMVKARRWWKMHAPGSKDPMPETVDAMLEFGDKVRRPKNITVDVSQKFTEITHYDFLGQTDAVDLNGGGPAGQNPHGDAGGENISNVPDLHEFQ